jgi:hypothetical protein
MVDYWCDSKEIARGIAERFNIDRPDFATLRQRLLDAVDAISDDISRDPLDPCTWRRIIRVPTADEQRAGKSTARQVMGPEGPRLERV